jgi:hypothetical protein
MIRMRSEKEISRVRENGDYRVSMAPQERSAQHRSMPSSPHKAMNWKIKALALAVLSRVPAGKRAYLALQTALGTNRLKPDEALNRVMNVVEIIREGGGDPCRGAYVEVGSGWWPLLPILLHLVGAERIITIDVNPWLTEERALEALRAFEGRTGVISSRLHLPGDRIAARFREVKAAAKDLDTLLRALNVTYVCPGDAGDTKLPAESIDFVCSSNVLEHMRPEAISAMHRESLRLLRPGGMVAHRFNPADHYSHNDSSITSVNFLKFSQAQWYWIGGSGLAYHNRLRCSQQRRMLENTGFSVTLSRVRPDERALIALKNHELDVHPDFAEMALEDLAGEYMWLVARKPQLTEEPFLPAQPTLTTGPISG